MISQFNDSTTKKAEKKGFTLIEMIVAIAIFSIIIGAISGIFVSGIRGQRRALATQQLLDNTSYTMEYMSRFLRMARKDTTGNCVLPLNSTNYRNYEITETGNGIRFLNYKSKCQEFRLGANRLQERKSTDNSTTNFGDWVDLTSEKLTVTEFNIGPDDSWDQDDTEQPRVTIFLEVEGKEQTRIKIQTSVSQRNLDIRQ